MGYKLGKLLSDSLGKLAAKLPHAKQAAETFKKDLKSMI